VSAFSTGIDAIFTDPNMAVDAIWREQRVGPPTTVRAIRKAPDELQDYGAARMVLPTTVIDVRVSEIALPRDGDLISIAGEDFMVQGAPKRDRERLVWTLDLVAQ